MHQNKLLIYREHSSGPFPRRENGQKEKNIKQKKYLFGAENGKTKKAFFMFTVRARNELGTSLKYYEILYKCYKSHIKI